MLGFMCGSTVLDKDGVSTAVVAAEMAAYLAERGISLTQQLNNIYEKLVTSYKATHFIYIALMSL